MYNAEELGLSTEASYKLSGLGRIALLKGDYAQSEELHRRAMRLAAEGSQSAASQFAEVGLGLVARRQGKLEIAEAHLSRWLNWCRQADGDMGAAFILAELGFIAEQRGDAEAALALHLDGFSSARATGDPRAVALALEGLAGATAAAGRTQPGRPAAWGRISSSTVGNGTSCSRRTRRRPSDHDGRDRRAGTGDFLGRIRTRPNNGAGRCAFRNYAGTALTPWPNKLTVALERQICGAFERRSGVSELVARAVECQWPPGGWYGVSAIDTG